MSYRPASALSLCGSVSSRACRITRRIDQRLASGVFALFRDGLLVSRGWNQPSGCVPFSISSPAATTAATPPTEVSFLHRPCFVDREVTSADFFAIESRDGLLGSGVVRHLHKAETLRATCIAIRADLNRFTLPNFAEQVTKVSFCDSERQRSNEDFFFHLSSIRVDASFFVGRLLS